MERFVLVRQYRPGDEHQCRRIVHTGTMSTVRPAFISALTREVTLQLVVVSAAVMFVFLSFSPLACLLSLPTTAILVYSIIYIAHMVKANTYSDDMLNIPLNYMSSEYTGFWVAEMFEPDEINNSLELSGPITIVRSENWSPPNERYSKRLIGTAALVRSNIDPSASRMRRVAVDPDYKRNGIASALIDEITAFARGKGYETIELVTTECHESARALYMKKGFELRQLYHKQILLNIVQILMYEFTYRLVE